MSNITKQAFCVKLEAENGELIGGAQVSHEEASYSGCGFVTNIREEGEGVTLTAQIPHDGVYKLTIKSRIAKGKRGITNEIALNGVKCSSFCTDATGFFEETIVPSMHLPEGTCALSFIKRWCDFDIDYVIIEERECIDTSRYNVVQALCNPNANETTRKVFAYLCDNYGKKMITGQYTNYDDAIGDFREVKLIRDVTGKEPAIYGTDFVEYSTARQYLGEVPLDHTTERAIKWWQEGGLVTYCWHWSVPNDINDWSKGCQFYTDQTSFDICRALDESTPEHDVLIKDIDLIAAELRKLEEADVPVLWRPLHEAAGTWFWWGAKGVGPYLQLYRLMYDRLTNFHHLNNLIWVWNGQHKDWYPGDDVVDIIGMDLYPAKHNYDSQVSDFITAQRYTTANKIIAYSENGVLPDMDNMMKDQAMWSWNGTWCGIFVCEERDGEWVYSERFTEADMLRKLYHHPNVITRDQLPNFRS